MSSKKLVSIFKIVCFGNRYNTKYCDFDKLMSHAIQGQISIVDFVGRLNG